MHPDTSSSSSGWGPPSANKGDGAIVDADGRDLATLALPESRAVFADVAWTAGATIEVFLRLRDDETAGAIMLDDVWLR